MAEQTRSEDLRPDVGCVTYMIEQRVINARLERLESSLDGITRAMDSLTRSVDRLLHAQAIEVSSSVTDAHMPANINSGLLAERLIKEQEAKEHEKKEEAHLYTIIKVARDEDLAKQIGKDIYFDLVDHDRVKCFRVKKQMIFNHFKEEVAKEFGIPVQFMRFWLWARRENHSYRPCRPLTPFEEIKSVWQLRKVLKEVHINLFLEVELGLDLCPIAPPKWTKDDILLFFKLYDPLKEELRYVGRLFVKLLGKPSEILMKLNEMAGYGREEEIVLYEEIKFEPSVMCEPIDKELSYAESQLEDGDIICFQKALRFPDVPSYLRDKRNRGIATFEKPVNIHNQETNSNEL